MTLPPNPTAISTPSSQYPPGIVYTFGAGNGHWLIEAGRALWYRLYLRRYCQLRSVSPEQVEAWLLPVAAARLSEGIAEEEKQLLALFQRLAA